MLKVALFARMGSGKSELAKRLVEEFGAKKVALGDALKQQVIQFNLTPDGKIDKARDRGTLQDYGQFRRAENRGFKFHNGEAKLVELEVVRRKWDEAFLLRDTGNPKYQARTDIGFAYPDFWVDILAPEVGRLTREGIAIVNDDIRRPNEWQAFKDWGFTMVKVHVDEEIRIQRLIARDGAYDPSRINDISEAEIDNLSYDVLIDNNDTIEKAWRTLKGVF